MYLYHINGIYRKLKKLVTWRNYTNMCLQDVSLVIRDLERLIAIIVNE